MRVNSYSYTNQGGRDHNEDSVRLGGTEDREVFVLADGLGGHGRGEVASALAADAVLRACLDALQAEETGMASALQMANQIVLDGQSEAGQEDMRTTAVALWLDGGQAVWGHIGDSRLYRLEDGVCTQLTADHSVTYRKYLGGEITRMDVYHDDDRSSLLRVLGKPACAPETGSGPLRPGQGYLLCSDGFWEYVYREEMLADFLKAEGPEQWARSMLLRRVRRAPEGSDNFSLITVFVEE